MILFFTGFIVDEIWSYFGPKKKVRSLMLIMAYASYKNIKSVFIPGLKCEIIHLKIKLIFVILIFCLVGIHIKIFQKIHKNSFVFRHISSSFYLHGCIWSKIKLIFVILVLSLVDLESTSKL